MILNIDAANHIELHLEVTDAGERRILDRIRRLNRMAKLPLFGVRSVDATRGYS